MIGIVTDSSSDLPAEVAREAGITVVPLLIRFGTVTLADGVDLEGDQFWTRLAQAPPLPETAAPPMGAFLDAFEAMGRDPDIEGVVCLTLSSELSATYETAVLAARQAALPIRVIDTRLVSMALGLAALAAAEEAGAGGDLQEVADAGARAAARANVFAAIDSLEYLERNGHIGRIPALIGGVLGIRPLLTLEQGVVASAGRTRSRAGALAAISRHLSGRRIERASVLSAGGADIGDLVTTVRALASEPLVTELGPVVGTHTGPGTLGVAYLEA